MIKVTTSEQESKPSNEYPKLVRYTKSGTIVLLTDESTGTCVKVGTGAGASNLTKLGDYLDTWNTAWPREDYTGTVTLENAK